MKQIAKAAPHGTGTEFNQQRFRTLKRYCFAAARLLRGNAPKQGSKVGFFRLFQPFTARKGQVNTD